MPPACWPTSIVATVRRAARSMISTVPGSAPTPSTVTKAYRSSGEMTTPLATFRRVGIRASSLLVRRSTTETDWPRLLVPTSSLPSRVAARLYTPGPIANRRVIVHRATSISTTSLVFEHATYTFDPSADGCAQVGEQVTSPGLDAPDVAWPLWPDDVAPAACATLGAPAIPRSLPFLSRKCRDTPCV